METIILGISNFRHFRHFQYLAEREGFEPSVPLLTAHTISSRAPSASSDISPKNL
jgi:hypothetical protein